jgi:hypothetical protein
VRANRRLGEVFALSLAVITSACGATHPTAGHAVRAVPAIRRTTVSFQTVAAWEDAASTPLGTLPPLTSLASSQIEHAWIQLPSANPPTPEPTLLTAQQVDRVAGWLRAAPQDASAMKRCPADPLPIGNTLYLDIRGVGILEVARVVTCRVTSSTGVDYSLSRTSVLVGFLGHYVATFSSTGLAGLLVQAVAPPSSGASSRNIPPSGDAWQR